MKTRFSLAAAVLLAIAFGPAMSAQWGAAEKVDLDAVFKIKEEGLQRSKVMEIESYLTDLYGPRLTGSTWAKEAGDWAITTMKEWGLANVHFETWPFGRGWTNERMIANVVKPRPFPIIGFAKAWTPGTNGPVTGEAVMAIIDNDKDLEQYRGKLRGKFVLIAPTHDSPPHFAPDAVRYTDAQLEDLALQYPQTGRAAAAGRGAGAAGRGAAGRGSVDQAFERRKMKFFVDEGVAALLDPGRGRGDYGVVGLIQAGGSRDPKDPPVAPQVMMAVEHYGRIVRTLEKKVPVTIQMDVDNKFTDGDLTAFNVIAEIPGTDKADEVVMLGGHFDSWHTGTGATDNGAGSAVMMEAMRILKTTGLKMRRTVRLGLWSGEEQGLLGSRAYVRDHLADVQTMQLKPDHAKLSAYYNLDYGQGAIRGVYLQGNEMVKPIFESWIEPLKSMGVTTITIGGLGSTDHMAFDAVGLPGFQFVQDYIDYFSRTHHSNMDVYEHVPPQDMMKNAVIVATFVYHTANRDEKLPRKPLPKAQPPGRGRATSAQQ
jgi:carboxypeptidase Q